MDQYCLLFKSAFMNIIIDIVDDHKMVIGGLKGMLMTIPGVTLGNAYENGKELLKGLQKQQPDILLLDIQMPEVMGDELAALILKSYPAIKIIAVTGYNTTNYAKLMLQAGVSGYILKNTDEFKLQQAIAAVYEGRKYIEPSIHDKLKQEQLGTGARAFSGLKPTLTRREKDMLQMIMDEMTSHQMAERMGLSLRTIENHRVSLMQKLDAKNMAGIVKRAFQLGLV